MHITQNDLVSQKSESNGESITVDSLGRVRKDELVRVLVQSLQNLGYRDAAEILEHESGITMEPETVVQFRQAVLQGAWSRAESILSSLPFLDPEDLSKATLLLRQQHFLELLESRKVMKALYVLRNDMTPLSYDTERLHQLSSLVLCSSAEDVRRQAQWDGAAGHSREQLLVDLQRYIIPSVMIPKDRLTTLIHQAFEWQRRECLYHSSTEARFSLFSDHVCDKSGFPSTTIQILEGHTDEVWHVAFSNNGQYLASASRDSTCIIWDMKTFEMVHVLSAAHQFDGSSYTAWSPDDSKILVCDSGDNCLRLWNVESGELLHTFSEHKDQNVNGRIVNRWSGKRVLDMKLSSDAKRLVTATYEKYIEIYSLDCFRLTAICQFSECSRITSLTLSHNGQYALVNIEDPPELHLWDLETQTLVHKYSGHRQHSCIIRSTFGGENDAFVLSGSEGTSIIIYVMRV
ncbi:hypothetical protein EC973_003855 [Apophysomyces ossiformis]|uniref:CTLH domain-containing protein n=1 Tax=Apophysomyces ossiformis TaxID=679940 RepID=A0A8H7ERM0_9FUNG|nr:hypothetical protein EC973_003855 [Apophysomyces ossiformis]